MDVGELISLALRLNSAGLSWEPEIGDEVVDKAQLEKIAILVDPQGLSPEELRGSFLWLPTIEQLLFEVENRQAFVFHAGSATAESPYEVVVKTGSGLVKGSGVDFRLALGNALEALLNESPTVELH